MKKLLLGILMLSTFGFSVEIINIEKAEKAYYSNNYKRAIKLYRKVIDSEASHNRLNRGNAQLNIGYMYETGKGVSKDLKKASELYLKVKSDTSFHYILDKEASKAYRKKDYEKAINFYQKGVDSNRLSAINNLAKVHSDRDKDVPPNTEKAKKLYLLASDLGDKEALIKIGNMYKYTNKNWEVTYQSLTTALKYYKISDKKHNNFSSKKEIAKAQLGLAELYLFGDGVTKNIKKAIHLYEKALYADERIMKSRPGDTYNLARIYAELNNFKKAFPLYLNAAENGATHAYVNIGYCYAKGKGVKRDKIKAYKAWLKAAKYGNKTAQNNLDTLCRQNPWACKE